MTVPTFGHGFAAAAIRASLLLVLVAPAAIAQSAPPNALIRAWPDEGSWKVMMVRTRALDGAPSCLLMTGYATAPTPGYRVWGLRQGGGRLWLIMSARQEMPTAEIGLFADGKRVGSFPVTERPARVGDVSAAVASVADAPSQALVLDALHAANTLGLAAGSVAAREAVDPAALRHFDECTGRPRPVS